MDGRGLRGVFAAAVLKIGVDLLGLSALGPVASLLACLGPLFLWPCGPKAEAFLCRGRSSAASWLLSKPCAVAFRSRPVGCEERGGRGLRGDHVDIGLEVFKAVRMQAHGCRREGKQIFIGDQVGDPRASGDAD